MLRHPETGGEGARRGNCGQELSKSWCLRGGISWCVFLVLEGHSYSARLNPKAEREEGKNYPDFALTHLCSLLRLL